MANTRKPHSAPGADRRGLSSQRSAQLGDREKPWEVRFPDGLDLMARWAPIAQADVLTTLAGDLFQPARDHHGRMIMTGGLVKAVARRAADAS